MKFYKDGGHAYPLAKADGNWHGGMTLRDYIAIRAMEKLMEEGESSDDVLAEEAYGIADAMIRERSKG